MPGLRPPKEDLLPLLPLETEKKILRCTIGATLFATLLAVIAVATDYWLILTVTGEPQEMASSTNLLVGSHSGLWRTCLDMQVPETQESVSNCTNLFDMIDDAEKAKTQKDTISGGPGVLLAYAKSYVAFALVAFFFLVLAHTFAIWAVRSQRYTIKRIAAVLMFITAICLLISIQILENSTESKEQYTEKIEHLSHSDLTHSFGFSYVLAWISFAIFLVAGVVFLFCSKKRPGSTVDSDVYIS